MGQKFDDLNHLRNVLISALSFSTSTKMGYVTRKAARPISGQVWGYRVFSVKWAFSIYDFLFCVPVPRIHKKIFGFLICVCLFRYISSSNRRTCSCHNDSLYDTQNLLKKCIFIVFAGQMMKSRFQRFSGLSKTTALGYCDVWSRA